MNNQATEQQNGDGFGCTCYAYYSGECACDADWTPSEIYKLRDRQSELEKLNGELVEVLEWLTFLMNGVGKSGGSPSSAEFEEANKASQEILIRYKQRHANLKKEV